MVLDKIGDFFTSPAEKVDRLLEKWEPERECKTEKQFEKSLAEFLRKECPKYKVQQQYGVGRDKIDIVVQDKVAIEIKNKFKTKSEFQRLIGQIEYYSKNFEKLFIVICGDADHDLLREVKKYVETKNDWEEVIKVYWLKGGDNKGKSKLHKFLFEI